MHEKATLQYFEDFTGLDQIYPEGDLVDNCICYHLM